MSECMVLAICCTSYPCSAYSRNSSSSSSTCAAKMFASYSIRLSVLSRLQAQKSQKEKELKSYKGEVYKAIHGESAWDQEVLNDLILDTKKTLSNLEADIAVTQNTLAKCDKAASELKAQYDKVLTWADLFEGSSMEGKKMIVWQVIDKVRIFRDYKIEIDLKISFEQFMTLWHRDGNQVTISFAA